MTNQTVEMARRAITAQFKSAAIDFADLDARLLTGHALGLNLTGMITAAQRQLTPDELARIEDFVRRRLAGEPVARIVGEKEFWGLPLQLAPATLVPRPDTETVVELALELLRGGRRPRSPAAHRRSRHRHRRNSAGAAVRIAGGNGIRHRHLRSHLATAAANAARAGCSERATQSHAIIGADSPARSI